MFFTSNVRSANSDCVPNSIVLCVTVTGGKFITMLLRYVVCMSLLLPILILLLAAAISITVNNISCLRRLLLLMRLYMLLLQLLNSAYTNQFSRTIALL